MQMMYARHHAEARTLLQGTVAAACWCSQQKCCPVHAIDRTVNFHTSHPLHTAQTGSGGELHLWMVPERPLLLSDHNAFRRYAQSMTVVFKYLQPLARWLLWKRGLDSVPAKLQRRIDKFCESAWKVTYNGRRQLGWLLARACMHISQSCM